MDAQQMRTKTAVALGRFSAVEHQVLKNQVLCGEYSLATSLEFDALIDELAASGAILRDQRLGWLRPAPAKASPVQAEVSTSSKPSGRMAALRKGGRHGVNPR